MAVTTLDLYGPQVLALVEQILQAAVGHPRTVITDEAQFRLAILEPGWDALPLSLRLMGRQRFQWDEFFLALRKEVFLAVDGKVTLRPDTPARIRTTLQRLFGAPVAVAPAVSPPPASAPPTVPLARVVQGVPVAGQVVRGIPIAHPVRAVPVAPPVPTRPAGPPPLPAAAPTAAQATSRTAVGGAPISGILKPAAVSGASGPIDTTVVGIDLGTTYSVIAHLDSQGRPWSIPNAAGDLITPSVVLFDDAGPVVGKEAVQAAAMEPEKIAVCVKRDMGSRSYRKKINGQCLPPEVISSVILRSLKTDAERKLGPIKKAVITVPAYFDESRRQATVDAGRLAGLEVLDIINEPTAAAIAYGYQVGFLDPANQTAAERPQRVLVYDLGGGTFDVTIVEIKGKSFKAIATDGDVSLGGKDWDEKLVDIAAEEYCRQHREDPRHHPSSLQELWFAAEIAKKTLSERPKATIYVNHLGTRSKVEITREQFEEATAALLGRTRTTSEIVVRQAGMTWANIDKVLLVGGSTRMPMVVRMLEGITGKPPERSVSPDEAVAYGAALYADLRCRQLNRTAGPPRFAVTNVNSHSLGIVGVDPQTGRRRNQILIPKNTPLPHTVTKVFKTNKPNQPNVVIKVVEGESERPEACIQVGVCTIAGLPPNLPVGWPVSVSYSYEADGRLRVIAQVKGQTDQMTTTFHRENRISDEEMQHWSRYVGERTKRMA